MMLQEEFFNRSTIQVAKDMLGCYIVSESKEGRTVGKIVETEAYLSDDPGSHTFKGKTKRNEVMFGPPGRAYVYFIYGAHHCINIVTQKAGMGEAVLIRALEPISGIDIMKKRRGKEDIYELCSGPGKLVVALGIDKTFNGLELNKRIKMLEQQEKPTIVATTRVGLSNGKDLPYRFYIRDNPFISRK
ncbi:DNA-3-methyladenine glycosylase [Candidatus Pacearchaeota archaeon]|nr:DNA-3-methyladenine glycosylase [Candidatus Pacearchaeota archaeon]